MMQEAKSAKARDRAVVPVIHYKTYLIDGLQQGLAQPTPNCGGDPSPSMGGMRGDITDHRDAVRTRIDVNTCRPDEFSALALDISGVLVNDTGKSGVILNGTVYEEGEYVDNQLLIKAVGREKIEFVYKGFTVVKTL